MGTANVTALIAGTRFNRFHFWLLFWGCFIITFDMYDLVIYGSVLPVLMKQWKMSPIEAGAIGSYGFFGMMLGAVAFGILADKFGRRNVLIASVVLFSVASPLCGFAPSPTVFSILRFFAGVGIGGILPTVIAMLTDWAPKGLANRFVAIIMSFFHVGGILAAYVAMTLLPFGWRSTYWVAALPLLALPFMVTYFVDSPATILARRGPKALRASVSRVTGRVDLPEVLDLPAAGKEQSAPVRELFRQKRSLGTLMIWVAFFMCLLMINGLTVWLPQLMVKAGYNLGSSLTFMIVLNVGAIAGTLSMGQLADRFGVKRVLVPMYIVSAVSLALMGIGGSRFATLALVFITGATAMGAQNISYAFVSQYYPSFMRSTAIGLASAIGRVGAIVGPLFGGVLLALAIPIRTDFLSFAIPGLIAALAFWLVPLAAAARNAALDHGEAADGHSPLDHESTIGKR